MRFSNGLLFLTYVLLLGCTPTHAQECSKDQAYKSMLAASDNLEAWDDVYYWFIKYKNCDDHTGERAESLNDNIIKLLAKKWSTFPELIKLTKQNNEFKKFVLSYLGVTADIDNIKLARKNTQNRCPPNARKLCKEITGELELTLQKFNEVQ